MKNHKSVYIKSVYIGILYATLLMLILAAIITIGVTKHNQERTCKCVGYSDRMTWNGDIYCIGVIDGETKVLPYDMAVELSQ